MPQFTRRALLKAGAGATMGATVLSLFPQPLLAHVGGPRPVPVPPIQDPDVKDLAHRAIEASRAAGAAYADVRLTHTWKRSYDGPLPGGSVTDEEGMHVGVRAQVKGHWGFASSPVWRPDEMGRLGREAVHQAKANSLGKTRPSELAPAVPVKDGHWVTPVRIDPFQVSPLEVFDMLYSLEVYGKLACEHLRPLAVGPGYPTCRFWMQDKAFASTEGSYCTQRLYRSGGTYQLGVGKDNLNNFWGTLDILGPAAVGWELYRDQPLREAIGRLVAEIEEDLSLGREPVDVGRYDVVMDSQCVARLLSRTLGRATELDRALGSEANAGGSSYLNDPLGMVGQYQVGADLLTVSGNRSDPGGCATVQWDDEGVTPDEITLVKDGVLTDFPTTRESASLLQPYYAGRRQPVRSHGCARATNAVSAPLIFRPNLVLQPGREALDFEGLVGTLKNGLAMKKIQVWTDFQGLNGIAPNAWSGDGNKWYVVKDGRRVARVDGGMLRLRSPELWKGLVAVGGAGSARRYGIGDDSDYFTNVLDPAKGEPPQPEAEHHSVTAPPAMFKQLAFVSAF